MVKVSYFDELEVPVSPDYDPGKHGGAGVMDAFLSLTSVDRLKDTRHVFAYY